MYIYFSGDRKSKTVKIGRWLKQYIKYIKIMLWDGYTSRIYLK